MAVPGLGRCWVVGLVVFVLVSGLLGVDPSWAGVGPGGGGVVAVDGFGDVEGGVHAPAIDVLEAEGVFDGTECGDGLFCPREPILRWVIAVWLIRVLGEEPAEPGISRFSDVDAGEWWAPYVEALADRGVTKGCDTEPLRFCPDESVSRAQMASFLVRAFALEAAGSAGFADTAGNTHEADIDALAAAGVTVGCKTDPLRFCPNKSVTRAEMATFLARAMGLVTIPDTGSGGASAAGVVVAVFDPFTTPTLSDLDLDRLAVAVTTLDETVVCPPTVAPESLDDVAEVVRIADGCMVVEYEPLRGRTVAQVREALSVDPTVHAVGVPPRDIHPDQASTTDSWRPSQWFLDAIGVEPLWDSWRTETEVVVAVIDSGVDATHPDLDANVLTVGDACHRVPNTGHGTHVAGIIAAERNNRGDLVGVAPNAKILPIKIHFSSDFRVPHPWEEEFWSMTPVPLDASCENDVPTLTAAITKAVEAGVDVINMSFKWSREEDDEQGQDTVEAAIRAATMQNIVVVAGAGNCGRENVNTDRCRDGRNASQRPAEYPGVIAVAATDDHNRRTPYSTSNGDVDIAAPGGGDPQPSQILSTWPEADMLNENERCAYSAGSDTRTCYLKGTSMAAPVISGVVAHMKNHHPWASVAEIEYALYSTADSTDDSETLTYSNDYGHGFVNPSAAIEALGALGNTYSAVEVGDNYSCGLRTGGTVRCWGLNNANQASPPVDTKFTAISAGQLFTCGLRLQIQTIQCWGQGMAPPDGEFKALTVDDNHGCAIKTDGLADCWVFHPSSSTAKAEAPANVRFADIAASAIHSCGLTDAWASLRSVKCWGDDEAAHGFSGGGQVSDRPRDRGFLEVAADSEYACAIRTNRTIICWGGDDIRGDPTGRTTPPPSDEFRDVAPGHQHACGIRVDGSIACWGQDTDKVLSDAPTSGTFTDISSGDFHSCALRDNGTIECWGRNNHGQTDVP